MADLYFVTLVNPTGPEKGEHQTVQLMADYLSILADSKLHLTNVEEETEYAFGKNRWVHVIKGTPVDDESHLTIKIDSDTYSVSQFSVDSTTGALMLNQSVPELVDGQVQSNVLYFKMINGLHWETLTSLSHSYSNSEQEPE